MAGESDLLMKLRPVSFYYKPDLDPTHTRQFGLVAEEVAQDLRSSLSSTRTASPRRSATTSSTPCSSTKSRSSAS